MGPPITYTIDGIQHISILAGFGGGPGLINPPGSGPVKPGFGRILTFTIGRAAPFNPLPFGHKDLPHPLSEVEVSARVVHDGELLYGFNCSPCHGVNAIAGALPDLRYASKQTLDEIESIVLGGSRAADGMPSFAKLLSAGQARSIRAFLVSRARESAKSGDVRR
jgi:quinohemoprotein ethanol dehydrogenase